MKVRTNLHFQFPIRIHRVQQHNGRSSNSTRLRGGVVNIVIVLMIVLLSLLSSSSVIVVHAAKDNKNNKDRQQQPQQQQQPNEVATSFPSSQPSVAPTTTRPSSVLSKGSNSPSSSPTMKMKVDDLMYVELPVFQFDMLVESSTTTPTLTTSSSDGSNNNNINDKATTAINSTIAEEQDVSITTNSTIVLDDNATVKEGRNTVMEKSSTLLFSDPNVVNRLFESYFSDKIKQQTQYRTIFNSITLQTLTNINDTTSSKDQFNGNIVNNNVNSTSVMYVQSTGDVSFWNTNNKQAPPDAKELEAMFITYFSFWGSEDLLTYIVETAGFTTVKDVINIRINGQYIEKDIVEDGNDINNYDNNNDENASADLNTDAISNELNQNNASKMKFNYYTIAGIALGAAFFGVVVAFLILLMVRKRRYKSGGGHNTTSRNEVVVVDDINNNDDDSSGDIQTVPSAHQQKQLRQVDKTSKHNKATKGRNQGTRTGDENSGDDYDDDVDEDEVVQQQIGRKGSNHDHNRVLVGAKPISAMIDTTFYDMDDSESSDETACTNNKNKNKVPPKNSSKRISSTTSSSSTNGRTTTPPITFSYSQTTTRSASSASTLVTRNYSMNGRNNMKNRLRSDSINYECDNMSCSDADILSVADGASLYSRASSYAYK